MIDWFHSMPNVLIGAILVATAALVCIILPTAVRRGRKLEVSSDVAKGAEEAFKLMSSLTMALLAFCLVQVQTLHRSVEDLAAREGTIILKADRALAGFDDAASGALRATLRRYAQSVADDEWPMLAKGERSAATTALLRQLGAGVKQLQAQTPEQEVAMAEVKGAMTQVNDVREARLSAAKQSLPAYFWGTIAADLVILVLIGWFQGPLPKMIVYVGGVTMGIAMLLTLLIVASGIFEGQSRVAPTAIIDTLPLLGR